MRRLAVVAVALGLTAPLVQGTAHAAVVVLDPERVCSFGTLGDPTAEPGGLTGGVEAGPVTLVDTADPATLHSGSLTCSVQVNTSTHAALDTVSVTGQTMTGVVLLPMTAISYSSDPGDNVYLCTQLQVDGDPPLYWDATNAEWSTWSGVDCTLALVTPPPPFWPMGIIEISGFGGSSASYTFDGFFPDISQWSCTISGLTVECDPPPPPAGFVNECRIVSVFVTNNSLGSVSGSSRCVDGDTANATASGPSNVPAVSAANPGGSFPWRCSATVDQAVPGPWLVRCTISH